jgi:transposase-like protein
MGYARDFELAKADCRLYEETLGLDSEAIFDIAVKHGISPELLENWVKEGM